MRRFDDFGTKEQIIERVFARKRFLPERMLSFGFEKTSAGYRCISDFMDGDFRAELSVCESGAQCKVIDNMNNEEYIQLSSASFTGAYVNSVRSAFEDLLEEIAENCCLEVLFASDQANRVTDNIYRRYYVKPDFPFGRPQHQSYGVFRHKENNKWFALLMNVRQSVLLEDPSGDTFDIVNLKIEPGRSQELCAMPGVCPAYHMNHKSWISVILDGRLNDEDVMRLVDCSFRLTQK